MIKKILKKMFPTYTAYAHCDVPCGIYDPKPAQIAAATVLKMVEKIYALNTDLTSTNDRGSFVRMVWTKEEHARKCKEELLILWTDYFKAEHVEKWSNLHDLFWKAAKLCSINKQIIDKQKAEELVKAVDEIAEIFVQSKAK